AIKYSPDGGVVAVNASLVGDEAWIWVRDEGLGIPTDHQSQIFTKFFRGDVGRELGIGGTGLGLVLARQIVEAHGGEIGFESTEAAGGQGHAAPGSQQSSSVGGSTAPTCAACR